MKIFIGAVVLLLLILSIVLLSRPKVHEPVKTPVKTDSLHTVPQSSIQTH